MNDDLVDMIKKDPDYNQRRACVSFMYNRFFVNFFVDRLLTKQH